MSKFDGSPLSFTRKPAADERTNQGVPAPIKAKAAARRVAMLAEAREVVAVLPGPGEALHGLMTGRYDLMQLVEAIIDAVGDVWRLRIATLSYNARNLSDLTTLVDDGRVAAVSLLCSAFFRDHNKELWQETQDEFRQRKGCVCAAQRSHAKVVAFEFQNGRTLFLEGSANLRTNGNREQFMLADWPEVYDWHASWIDRMIAEGGNGAA